MAIKKRCIIFYTEGETEQEFYDALLCEIKKRYKIRKFNADKILKKCLRGITKFDKKLLKKFEYEIIPTYKEYEIIVFLCYDTDVFDCSVNPPVDWNNVEKELTKLGANKVIHVKAEKCIEDIFLSDIYGICKFLNISEIKRVSGKNGVEKMQQLFDKGNRIYQKGYACLGFVKSLDIEKIISNNKKMFEQIINEVI